MEGKQIYELIGKAMADLGPIAKTKKNKEQGYSFRGIDDVYNALNPIMSKYGLFIVPRVLERTREERQTAKGYRLIYTVLKIQFTMYAPDGSCIDGITEGEGMDSADKSTNKAMSAAYKYFMFQLFNIPTEETAVDADAETPPPSGPVPKPQPEAPQKQPEAPKQQPAAVVAADPAAAAAAAKEKCVKTLRQNAIFAYGAEAAEAKLTELLNQFGMTLETMTGPIFKQVNALIMRDVAQKGSAA